MSLSSLLLPQKAPLDTELDSLFKVPVAKPVVASSSKVAVKKRKLDTDKQEPEIVPSKRTKPSSDEKSTKPVKVTSPTVAKAEKSKEKAKKEKVTGKGKGKEVEPDEDEEDEDRLENDYLTGKSTVAEESVPEEDEGDENVEGASELVHESLSKKNRKSKAPKIKHVPAAETPERRDQRTIFVGNLPLDVASKKPLQKQLRHHILSFLPTAKIESIRFRSVPFQAPTAKLEDEDEGVKKKSTEPKRDPRAHDKERTSLWRSKLDEKDEEKLNQDEKRYLNPAQKKKIAFINQEFHSSADTINAYIVFGHPPNTEGRPANLPPLPPTMDPYQAALSAAEKNDGTMFMERMLRVDLATKNKPTTSTTDAVDETVAKPNILETDPRLSVFVGNLDFASKEEDLRIFFEGLMSVEKGRLPKGDNDENTTRPANWVTRVRIIRDKDTQLGKGFAYIQFAQRECVDELLALEEEKLKFAKRKLRVQRCKTAPGSKQIVTQRKERAPAVVVPKGDPRLGEKLHGLPKEERKQIKSTDADRVARRLAKKKARMAMAPGVGKSQVPKGKDRKRTR